MNWFSIATHSSINKYRNSKLGTLLCGEKPFGSRHWEYPWAVQHSDILNTPRLNILDVAPDFTFPFSHFLKLAGHTVTFIDIEERQWSGTTTWGINPDNLKENNHLMDVRQMDFPDDHFDCIFCISVLEHIVCPTQDPDHPELRELFDPLAARPALIEMKRCLKPGGRLLITIDIYGGPKWSSLFTNWGIISDLESSGFPIANATDFDQESIIASPDSFISEFHGPYITLGFRLVKQPLSHSEVLTPMKKIN